MTNRRMTRMSLVVVMSAVPLALSSVSAAAATGPSRGTGLIGGCNMLRDATMLPGTGWPRPAIRSVNSRAVSPALTTRSHRIPRQERS
jgi:hypothetical protein